MTDRKPGLPSLLDYLGRTSRKGSSIKKTNVTTADALKDFGIIPMSVVDVNPIIRMPPNLRESKHQNETLRTAVHEQNSKQLELIQLREVISKNNLECAKQAKEERAADRRMRRLHARTLEFETLARLQARIKGVITRMRLRRLKQAATKIQRCWRAWREAAEKQTAIVLHFESLAGVSNGRKSVVFDANIANKTNPVKKLGDVSIRESLRKLSRMSSAANNIQRIFRGFRERILNEKRLKAVLKIQSCFRGALVRAEIRKFQTMHMAASIIQFHWLKRQAVRQTAALSIQAAFRGYCFRALLAKLTVNCACDAHQQLHLRKRAQSGLLNSSLTLPKCHAAICKLKIGKDLRGISSRRVNVFASNTHVHHAIDHVHVAFGRRETSPSSSGISKNEIVNTSSLPASKFSPPLRSTSTIPITDPTKRMNVPSTYKPTKLSPPRKGESLAKKIRSQLPAASSGQLLHTIPLSEEGRLQGCEQTKRERLQRAILSQISYDKKLLDDREFHDRVFMVPRDVPVLLQQIIQDTKKNGLNKGRPTVDYLKKDGAHPNDDVAFILKACTKRKGSLAALVQAQMKTDASKLLRSRSNSPLTARGIIPTPMVIRADEDSIRKPKLASNSAPPNSPARRVLQMQLEAKMIRCMQGEKETLAVDPRTGGSSPVKDALVVLVENSSINAPRSISRRGRSPSGRSTSPTAVRVRSVIRSTGRETIIGTPTNIHAVVPSAKSRARSARMRSKNTRSTSPNREIEVLKEIPLHGNSPKTMTPRKSSLSPGQHYLEMEKNVFIQDDIFDSPIDIASHEDKAFRLTMMVSDIKDKKHNAFSPIPFSRKSVRLDATAPRLTIQEAQLRAQERVKAAKRAASQQSNNTKLIGNKHTNNNNILSKDVTHTLNDQSNDAMLNTNNTSKKIKQYQSETEIGLENAINQRIFEKSGAVNFFTPQNTNFKTVGQKFSPSYDAATRMTGNQARSPSLTPFHSPNSKGTIINTLANQLNVNVLPSEGTSVGNAVNSLNSTPQASNRNLGRNSDEGSIVKKRRAKCEENMTVAGMQPSPLSNEMCDMNDSQPHIVSLTQFNGNVAQTLLTEDTNNKRRRQRGSHLVSGRQSLSKMDAEAYHTNRVSLLDEEITQQCSHGFSSPHSNVNNFEDGDSLNGDFLELGGLRDEKRDRDFAAALHSGAPSREAMIAVIRSAPESCAVFSSNGGSSPSTFIDGNMNEAEAQVERGRMQQRLLADRFRRALQGNSTQKVSSPQKGKKQTSPRAGVSRVIENDTLSLKALQVLNVKKHVHETFENPLTKLTPSNQSVRGALASYLNMD